MNIKKRFSFSLLLPVALIVLSAGGQIQCGNSSRTTTAPLSGRYRNYNVIILVLDTLRADHLGCYGYFRDTSPRIDAWAKDTLKFDRAFASLPITLPSHTSILTGLYPQNASVLYNYGRVPDKLITLAEILKEKGYQTGAVVSTAVLKRNKNLDQGFDRYFQNYNAQPSRADDPAWKYKGVAENANRIAFDWLKMVKKGKFFLFINYYDIHSPYIEHKTFQDKFDPDSEAFLSYLQEEWTRMPKPDWKRKVITFYDRSIAYTDLQIGQFLDRIKKLGLRDKTLIIITSDHGNGLYQHRDYWSHGLYLYDEQIKIPLLVFLPGLKGGREIDEIVETVDFMPTILDLLAIPCKQRIDGRSMVPLIETGKWSKPARAFALRRQDNDRGELLPKQFSVRTADQKLIATLSGPQEFYDLSRDPYEKKNIYRQMEKEEGGLVSRLLLAGEKWFQRQKVEKIKPGAPDRQTLKELRSLGYVQ